MATATTSRGPFLPPGWVDIGSALIARLSELDPGVEVTASAARSELEVEARPSSQLSYAHRRLLRQLFQEEIARARDCAAATCTQCGGSGAKCVASDGEELVLCDYHAWVLDFEPSVDE